MVVGCIVFHPLGGWNNATATPWNATMQQVRGGIRGANSACVPEAKAFFVKALLRELGSSNHLPFLPWLSCSSWSVPEAFGSNASSRLPKASSVGCCCRTTPWRTGGTEDKDDATETTGTNRTRDHQPDHWRRAAGKERRDTAQQPDHQQQRTRQPPAESTGGGAAGPPLAGTTTGRGAGKIGG